MAIKTLHLTNFYHPSSGGIRTFYQALVKAADEHRRFVRLVVPGPENSVEEVGEYGRIYHVAAPRSPVIDPRYRVMLPHTYAWPYESELRRILVVERPDLVEVCDKFMLCYLPGVLRHEWIPGVPVPVFVGLTCERLDDSMAAFLSESRFAEWLCEFYMRNCYVPRFDFHLAVSDYIAGEVRRVLPERMAGRLYVAPMGVECELFRAAGPAPQVRQQLLKECGGRDRTRLVLYAGRLSREKNLLLLPEVLAKLAEAGGEDYRLVIAGDGPFRDELHKALGQGTPGKSLFLGQQKRDELASLFKAVDLFIHPNPREPFGIGPLEAMAGGLPLVAPASGGLLMYANQENAWLAEETAESFADAVRSVFADSAERARRCEKARSMAESLSWRNVTSNYFRLYEHFYERSLQEGLVNSSAALSRAPQNEASGERLTV